MAHSGERTFYVTVQERPMADARGDSGFPVETWTDLGRVWMGRRQATGRETFTADQIAAASMDVWNCSYRPDLDPDLEDADTPKLRRIVHAGRVYDVQRVNVLETMGHKQELELMTLASTGPRPL